jgi:hypothetical protein
MTWININNAHVINQHGQIRSIRSGKMLRPYVHQGKCNQYLRVSLFGKKHYVHRLVFQYFTGEICTSKEIDHIDGNTFNNCVSNLMAVTKQVNNAKRSNFKKEYSDITCVN